MATKQWKIENRKSVLQYGKDYYKQTKEKQKRNVVERRRKLREWLVEYKSKLKCEICGFNHLACLTFHHKDPNDKDIEVSRAISTACWSKDRILREISKCQVLCANCHNILHYNLK